MIVLLKYADKKYLWYKIFEVISTKITEKNQRVPREIRLSLWNLTSMHVAAQLRLDILICIWLRKHVQGSRNIRKLLGLEN